MTLLDRLNDDMKQALKNKEKDRLTVIRMVKAAIQNEAINNRKDLSEEEEIQILMREVKQRKESLQEFNRANREDLVEKVENELDILSVYLPEQLSDGELEKIIIETIQELGALSKKDIGKVMKAVMPKIKGKADGSKVNKLVMNHLQ